MSNDFINVCKKRTNSNRLGKIKIAEKIKASGKNISIENSLGNSDIDLTLHGYTKQNSYSGKQLYDVNDAETITKTLKDENDWITMTYDNTDGTSNKYINYWTNPSKKIKADTQYAILVEVKEVSGDAHVNIVGTQSNAPTQFTSTFTLYFGRITPGIYKSVLTSVSSDIEPISMLRTFASFFPGKSGSITFRISVLEDINVSTNNFVYEPYTGGQPSPSPDYPQEIEVVTGSVEVKSTGKNLFNALAIKNKNIIVSDDGKIITMPIFTSGNGYTATGCLLKELCPTLRVGDKVILDFVRTTAMHNNFIYLTLPTNMLWGNHKERIITENDLNSEVVLYGNRAVEDEFDQITLTDFSIMYLDEIDKTWEPYKESSVQYSLGNNFLAEQDYIENGVLNKNIRKVVLDGSENWIYDSTYKYFRCPTFDFGMQIPVFNKNQLSNYFNITTSWATFRDNVDRNFIFAVQNKSYKVCVRNVNCTTVEQFKTWLSTHNVEVYYELETSEQIQLETTGELKTFEGSTIITNNCDCNMDVTAQKWNKEISNSNNLQSIEIDSGCYADGNIIGSVHAKCLKANFIADQNNLVDKSIQAQIGVKYADLSNEYINMGKYKVERPNNEITANYSQITAYDDLYTNLDKKYVCNIDYSSNDKTVSDLYIDVCNQLGLTPVTTEFINSTIPITSNPFTNGESNRTVLQTVAKIACSFIDIDNDTNEIDLCWLSDSEEPDYIFEYNDGEKALYSTVEGGQVVCGPINCLIIKNSQIDDENVTIKDEESITENGEHSITISEDYILYNAELRELAITNIWNRVKGMKYVDCKLTTYYGTPFLKLGSKIRIYTNLTDYFDTYVLKHNFTFDGTFTSIIESPALTEQEIKTKQNVSLQEALRNTQIEVNKQSGEIKAITKKTTEMSDDLNNNYYTKTNINELVQTSETGLTNTFSEAGGNNVLRNTGLFASEGTNKYEFWDGNVIKNSNENAISRTSMMLQKGTLSQEQEVPNGSYSISFYYKKLIELANASVIINDIEYELDSLDVKQFYTGEQDSETKKYITQPINVTNGHIKIVFKCDTNNAVEVYDLMCNKGSVKLAYSQNQNETTTDTVKISKGITIESSADENVKFKADYDGIRTINKANEIITKFTDKGMDTNEARITVKAEITGLLYQEVDDQTWVTKI